MKMINAETFIAVLEQQYAHAHIKTQEEKEKESNPINLFNYAWCIGRELAIGDVLLAARKSVEDSI